MLCRRSDYHPFFAFDLFAAPSVTCAVFPTWHVACAWQAPPPITSFLRPDTLLTKGVCHMFTRMSRELVGFPSNMDPKGTKVQVAWTHGFVGFVGNPLWLPFMLTPLRSKNNLLPGTLDGIAVRNKQQDIFTRNKAPAPDPPPVVSQSCPHLLFCNDDFASAKRKLMSKLRNLSVLKHSRRCSFFHVLCASLRRNHHSHTRSSAKSSFRQLFFPDLLRQISKLATTSLRRRPPDWCSHHVRDEKRIAARVRSSGCAFHVRDEKSMPARVRSSGCAYHVRDEKSIAARVRSSGCVLNYHARDEKSLPARVRSSGCAYHVRDEKSIATRVRSSRCVLIMRVTQKALLRACGRAVVLLMCVARAVERVFLSCA